MNTEYFLRRKLLIVLLKLTFQFNLQNLNTHIRVVKFTTTDPGLRLNVVDL